MPAAACHRKIDPGGSFDDLDTSFKPARPQPALPEPSVAGASGFQNLPSWYAQNFRITPLSATGAERRVQQDGVWTVTLAKSEFGLSWNLHSLSEADCASNFAGIATAQVNAKQERDIGFDWAYRITTGAASETSTLRATQHNGPQIKAVTLTAANQGQYFWNNSGDLRVDTKYFDDLTLSAAAPLFGSVRISPQIHIFAFRSKFDAQSGMDAQPRMGAWHIHGYQTSVSLSYCFDRDSGVPWKKALKYDSCGNSKK